LEAITPDTASTSSALKLGQGEKGVLSIGTSANGTGWYTYNGHVAPDMGDDGGTGTDLGPFADIDQLTHDRADANPTAFANGDPASEVGTWRNMHPIGQDAVMIHCRAGIDYDSFAETGSYIDHGTGEHHGPNSNPGAGTHPGPRVNERDQGRREGG
jgi:hypothetical protein